MAATVGADWPLQGEAYGLFQLGLGNATAITLQWALDDAQDPETRVKLHAEFADAVAERYRQMGERPPTKHQLKAMAEQPMLYALGFTQITLDELFSTDTKYLDVYWRPAVRTALNRGGTIHLHTGHFCFHRYFRDLAAIALEEAGDDIAEGGDAVGRHLTNFFDNARISQLRLMPEYGGEPKTSFTCAEMFDAMEGGSSEAIEAADEAHYSGGEGCTRKRAGLGVIYSDGTRAVDAREFRRLYKRATDALRTRENLDHFRKHGVFEVWARKAVRDLQAFTHGTTKSLPTPAQLSRRDGCAIAADRSLWSDRDAWGGGDV